MPPTPDHLVSDPTLLPIAEKVLAHEPLSHADGLALYRSRDVHSIGRLANLVKTRLYGDKVFFNRNRHINYTNVCALSCKFCSFYRKRGEEGAYEMPLEQVIATAVKARDAGATEVHIVGGLHPWLKFDYYLDMLRGIRRECPDLHIKAFTAIELIHFTRIARLSIADVLTALRDAGLGSLPGGGAEIFDDRVHDEVFKGKVRHDKWFEVHRTAHSLGIFSNATMLYGHVETPEERIGHMIKLRDLQSESLAAIDAATCHPERSSTQSTVRSALRTAASTITVECHPERSERERNERLPATGSLVPTTPGSAQISSPLPCTHGRGQGEGSSPRSNIVSPAATIANPRSQFANPPKAAFNCMIPLSFIPENSDLGNLPGPTGLTDLKTLAIARLMLHNIPHIKAFWIMQGVGLSQLALSWGCDDLDGTVVWYDITKRHAHGTTHQELHVEDIKRLIRETRQTPVERDTLYREVHRDTVHDAQPRPSRHSSEPQPVTA